MRFVGQAYELPITVDDLLADDAPIDVGAELSRRFEAAHAERYGHCPPRQVPQIVNLRLTVTAPAAVASDELDLAPHQTTGPVSVTEGTIEVTGQPEPCRFYRRETLPAGFTVDGPAVIEEGTATGYIPAGWRGVVDARGNILVTRPSDGGDTPT